MRLVMTTLLCGVCLFGQANTGSIRGTVSDSTGAVVPHAKISLTNVKTGVQASVTTDGLGDYLFEVGYVLDSGCPNM